MDSTTFTTKIGLEIHVQLKTKSKMFCSCDNNAEGKRPNSVVCPICLAMPGTLPVANKEAILWTIKTGLTLNCKINKIAKFDRKHYFYPDLPKGYQISQYNESFAIKGSLKSKVKSQKSNIEEETTIRINRVHLEEDAGKLIHREGKSLVDLNRAGTPLMEIVTEPDITTPRQAGDFLRKLQKIVRDEVEVSEASMEKGHMRCDANISVSDDQGNMSKIVELKNVNSFRFIERALEIEENKLKEEYPAWPKVSTKATHGYDSKKNETYIQREKEEAADYRYFPEPDLPTFDTEEFNLEILRSGIGESEEIKIGHLIEAGLTELDAKILITNSTKEKIFNEISKYSKSPIYVAKAIVHNYFGFEFDDSDFNKSKEYAKAVDALEQSRIYKNIFSQIVKEIHTSESKFDEIVGGVETESDNIEQIVEEILVKNQKEVELYKGGKTQLFEFFMGQIMSETKGRADPQAAKKILKEKLES